MPFYTLQINTDGTVYPSCTFGAPVIGNINKMSLKEIWEKQAFHFQRRMLDGVDGIPFCSSCASMKYRVQPEDAWDGHAQNLKQKYVKIIGLV